MIDQKMAEELAASAKRLHNAGTALRAPWTHGEELRIAAREYIEAVDEYRQLLNDAFSGDKPAG